MKFVIKKQNIILLLSSFVFLFIPYLVFAQSKIVPDCGADCGYGNFIELINNIIKYLLILAVPVCAGVIAYAGLKMMMNPDNSGVRNEAKDMMLKAITGFAVIALAWIIVSTILNAFIGGKGTIKIEDIPVDLKK